MKGYERLWMDMNGYERLWKDVKGYERLWIDMKGCEWIWTTMNGYERMWKDMHDYEWIWKDMKGYERICKPWVISMRKRLWEEQVLSKRAWLSDPHHAKIAHWSYLKTVQSRTQFSLSILRRAENKLVMSGEQVGPRKRKYPGNRQRSENDRKEKDKKQKPKTRMDKRFRRTLHLETSKRLSGYTSEQYGKFSICTI